MKNNIKKETLTFIFLYLKTSEDLDLVQLLPETYQGGPGYYVESKMKIRVRIDENGIEGAAIVQTCFADSIGPSDEIMVDKPYMVLVYDEELQQTLFTVKDTGLKKK